MSQNQLSMFERQETEGAAFREVCRRMGVTRLTLRNWKRFKEYTLEPGGENLEVYGDNETGKSTLEDAFMWLFFDKDSLNRKDFEIKPIIDEAGNTVHHLEHEVEGTITLDEKLMAFKKVLKEKWTKKRGQPVESFTGHETEYFIDGVPVAKGKYDERVQSIIDEKVFRLLSDPRYFNEVLHWQEKRQLLIEVCGGLSDQEVIESDERLSALEEILGSRTIEEHKKVIKAQHAKIKKELEEIPIRISEAERNLPDCSGTDTELLDAEIGKIAAEKNEKSGELARAENGAGVSEKIAELRAIQSEVSDREAAARRQLFDAQAEKRRALQQAGFDLEQAERSYRSLTQEADAKAQEAENLEGKLTALRTDWDRIDAEEFTWEGQTTCWACGQELPECKVEEAKEKALSEFNLKKSQKLEANEAEGKATAKRKEALEKEAVKYRNEAALQKKKAQEQVALVSRLQAEIAKMPTTVSITSPDYNKLAMERDRLITLIASMKEDSQAAVDPMRQEIAEISAKLQDLQRKRAEADVRRSGEKRIEELLSQEKKLTAEYERLSQELYLTEEFTRIQAKMLESKVASKFSFVRFKLFDQQINGGLAECCETLVKGVPYGRGLNNAAKIQAGLDIINTLSHHYGFIAPIWLDNRESVTRIPATDSQVISLIVSPKDKELRIVYPNKEVQ